MISLAVARLKDSTLENCHKACKTLSGLLRCALQGSSQLEGLLSQFEKESAKSATKKLAVRHAGVLGLVSMLHLHPYRLESWGARVSFN